MPFFAEILLISVAGALSGWLGALAGRSARRREAYEAASQATEAALDEVTATIAQEKVRTAALRDEARELYDRSENARARAAAAAAGVKSGEARRANRDGPTQPVPSEEEYLTALDRGAPRDPAIEAQLWPGGA